MNEEEKYIAELNSLKPTAGQDKHVTLLHEQQEYLANYLRAKSLRLGDGGAILDIDGAAILPQVFLHELFNDYQLWEIAKGVKTVNRKSKKFFRESLETMNLQTEKQRLLDLRASLNGTTDVGLAELRRFARALQPHATPEEHEFTTQVFASFVWQVKSKIFGRPITDHLMPVIYGPQGVGKSTAILRLLRPIRPYVADSKMDIFSDNFSRNTFTENYIVFFDEMAGAERTDVDRLKNHISADLISGRAIYTSKVDKLPQNSTFIGCSNRSVRDLVWDSTGMRRFVEIEVGAMHLPAISGYEFVGDTKKDYANPIDFKKIWESVPLDKANPIHTIHEQITEHQAKLRAQTYTELWVIDEDLEPGETRVSKKVVYAGFRNWCRAQDIKVLTMNKFSRELNRLGFKEEREASTRFWMMNKKYGGYLG